MTPRHGGIESRPAPHTVRSAGGVGHVTESPASKRSLTPCGGAPCHEAAWTRLLWVWIVREVAGRGAAESRIGRERLQSRSWRIRLRKNLFRSLACRPGSQARFCDVRGPDSEAETPLHRLETVYRRLMERLSTVDTPQGALRNILDGWFYTWRKTFSRKGDSNRGSCRLVRTTLSCWNSGWRRSTRSPLSSVRPCAATARPDEMRPGTADGLLAWLSGQPNVSATVKRAGWGER